MPGLRQRRFPRLGNGPALANLPDLGRTLSVVSSHHLLSIVRTRSAGLWKMRVDGIALIKIIRRDRLGSLSKKTGLRLREGWTLRSVLAGRWTNGVLPQRVTWSGCAHAPLYPQWPRLDSIDLRFEGQHRNTSSRCNPEIRSQARVIPGTAALVTTPLRSLVTRALRRNPSCPPGSRLSCSLKHVIRAGFQNGLA